MSPDQPADPSADLSGETSEPRCPHCEEALTERQAKRRFCPKCDLADCPRCGAGRARGEFPCESCGNLRLEFLSSTA